MLFDPKWGGLSPRPSFAGLVAWLETQDPDTTYDWQNIAECLCGRYYKAIGVPRPIPGGEEVVDFVAQRTPSYTELFQGNNLIDYWYVGAGILDELLKPVKRDWTYGAALKRAKELASRKPHLLEVFV